MLSAFHIATMCTRWQSSGLLYDPVRIHKYKSYGMTVHTICQTLRTDIQPDDLP
jgi:hypothetical protein